ncbi:MAG: hypothetical protein ACI9NQ_000919 [Paracoccaceae bacterium]|jgi:hypothetical protein
MKKIPLLIIASLGLVSCQQEEKAQVIVVEDSDPQVIALEEQVDSLREQLVAEQNLRFRQNTEQTAMLAELKSLIKGMAKEKSTVAALEASVVTKEEALEPLDQDMEAARVARLKAQGEKHARLTTLAGVTYLELVISRVTEIGVIFRHQGGVARIPFSDLPVAWQERFYYDQDRALLALRHERLVRVRNDRAAIARLAVLNEQEKDDAQTMSLERLAKAVADIRRGNPAPIPVIQDRIFIEPPIIVNHHYDNDDDIYGPPIVRPKVVGTPLRPIPTVRNGGNVPTVRPAHVPTVRPTPIRPTTQRPSQRPTPTRPVVQRPRPTPQTPTVQRPSSRPAPSRPAVQRPRTATPTPAPRQVTPRQITPRRR